MSYKSKFIFPVHEEPSKAHLERLVKQLEIEFKSIQKAAISANSITVISVPLGGGGGGGIPASRSALFVSQPVVSGAVTISFIDVGTAQYGVTGYVLQSNGDIGIFIPNVPPLTDSRSSSSVTGTVYDTGTLIVFIILP
jgi:hypothetical protein